MGAHAGTIPIVTDNLDQLYDFNETDSISGATVTSLITSSDEMTLVNSPTVSGGTCTLDGSNDAISLDSSSNLYSANSLAECWELAFRIKSGTGEASIMHQSNVWYYRRFFNRNSDGYFWMRATGAGGNTDEFESVTSQTIENNEWYVMACNFSRSSTSAKNSMNGFINGVQVGSMNSIGGKGVSGPWSIGTGGTPVIGATASDGSNSVNMEIAYFRKYGKNLSSSEILSNYNAMKGRLV